MWPLSLGLLLLLAGALLIVWVLSATRSAELTRNRLRSSLNPESLPAPVSRRSHIVRRRRGLVAATGAGLTGTLWLLVALPLVYVLAFGVMLTMLLWQVEEWWRNRRIARTEQQLADSIDMMVASVKSGAGLQSALESAMNNTPRPWKGELNELIARIRYGDDPLQVFSDLSQRVPLETVHLFAQTLAVNWSVGGRLSLALANVSRTIRDRLELSRRMQAMTTQARLSVISVLSVTYFIGALMWRNDPERMGQYLGSLVGQSLVATAMLLQAVGIVWIARLSTPRF